MRFCLYLTAILLSSFSFGDDEIVSHCQCNQWGLEQYPGILSSEPTGEWDVRFLWESPDEIQRSMWSWRGVGEYKKLYPQFHMDYEIAYEKCLSARRNARRNFRVAACLAIIEAEKSRSVIEYERAICLPNLKAKYRTYIPHRYDQSWTWHQAQPASFFSDEEIEKHRNEVLEIYSIDLEAISRLENNLCWLWEEIYAHCKSIHRCRQTSYDQGLLDYHRGDFLNSANQMAEYIAISKELADGQQISADDYLCLSTAYQFALQYEEAIRVLDEAIERYPDRKDLYIHRIAAYFEVGRYDEAISDFVLQNLDKELQAETNPSKIALAKAFLSGSSRGLVDGAREYPTSLLYSLRGTGQMIWAGIQDPIGVPKVLMSDISTVITLIRNGEYNTILQAVAPELCDLCKEWDSLAEEVRWEKAGYVFGKYGFDWLANCGQKKFLDLCLKLRATNTLCTVKTAFSAPEKKVATILTTEQIAARRAEYFSKAKIHWDKQGKHIEGHNSRKTLTADNLATYSILTHKNPEGLLKNHAGKGAPMPRRENGKVWDVGYREDVNFGEVIGLWKSRDGKQSKETTWGRIHYNKDATAHIVPIEPKNHS